DGIRDDLVTGVQTCALPIFLPCVPTEHQPAQCKVGHCTFVQTCEDKNADPQTAYLISEVTEGGTKFGRLVYKSGKTVEIPCHERSEERRVGKEYDRRWETTK